MRLIDTDEIHFVFSRGNNRTILQEVLLTILAEAPTVDAIPIEWIESQVDKGKWHELVQRWEERKEDGELY